MLLNFVLVSKRRILVFIALGEHGIDWKHNFDLERYMVKRSSKFSLFRSHFEVQDRKIKKKSCIQGSSCKTSKNKECEIVFGLYWFILCILRNKFLSNNYSIKFYWSSRKLLQQLHQRNFQSVCSKKVENGCLHAHSASR